VPTGRSREWSSQVSLGMTAEFEIREIDVEKKRIGVALVPEGFGRADVREYVERASGREGFGSLADQLRRALEPPEK
jgi:hypothetical protein